MDREEQSDTEVIRIWPGQRETTRTMQSQQLQLGTNKLTSGAITALAKEEAICQPINTHNPCSVMCCEYRTTSHAEMKSEKQRRSRGPTGNKVSTQPTLVGLSLENLILFQTDIVWESYIATAYKTNDSGSRLPYADTSIVDTKRSSTCLLFQMETQFHANSYRSRAANSSCKSCSKQSIHAIKGIRDQEIAGKIDNQRPLKRKLPVTPLGTEEMNAKKQALYNFHKNSDTPKLSTKVSERKNIKMLNGCYKNPDKCLELYQTAETVSTDLCSLAKRYPGKQSNLEETGSTLRKVNILQICSCTRDGYEICNVNCSLGSMLKDAFLGEIDVFTSIFFPETDSMVDYIVPYSSWNQKGHCKTQNDSEESLFLKTSTDSSVNPHGSLSPYPQMTSNVIFNNGDDKPIISQSQVLCEWLSHEKSDISANMLKSSPLLQKKQLSFIYEKNYSVGSKLSLSTKMSFLKSLSYYGKLKKQYFLPNISSSIQDLLLGMPINDFAYSQSSISGVQYFPQNGLQILQHLFEASDIKDKKREIGVILGMETINKNTKGSHLDFQTACNNQGLCFSSHHLNAIESTEEETLKKNAEECWMQSYPKQETFKKICLDIYTVENQSNNLVEKNSFFHNEKLLFQNQVIPDSSVAIESEFGGCSRKCHSPMTQNCNEFHVFDADCKVGKKEQKRVAANKEIKANVFQDSTYCFENSIHDGRKQKLDIFYKAKSETEDSEILKLKSSNKEINQSFDTANGIISEIILDVVAKEGQVNINKLEVEGASLVNSEKPNCVILDDNYSLEGNTNTDFSNLTTEEPDGLTLHTFKMKAQFDLVLEELKMFHSIGQNNEKLSMADDKEMCSTLVESPCISIKDLPSDSRMVGDDCELNDKTFIQARFQEVPQASYSASSGDKESLYPPVKEGNTGKKPSWTPSFTTYGEGTVSQHIEKGKEVTFSHGIGRVTPLKTRSGPLRIGLSKKAKIKQLHPYLR